MYNVLYRHPWPLLTNISYVPRAKTPVFIYFSLYEQLPPTFWMIIHCKHNRHLVFILKQSHHRDLKYDKELILRICKLFFLWSDLRHMSLPPIQRMNVHLPINSVCPNSCPPRVRLPAELDGQQITHRIWLRIFCFFKLNLRFVDRDYLISTSIQAICDEA